MADENMNTTTTVQNDTQGADNTNTSVNTTTDTNVNQNDQNNSQNDSGQTDIEKLIQKSVDRATNKLGNENKKLREQLDELRKQGKTAEEIKKMEMAEKEERIAEREAKIQERENRLFAIKAIKEIGLDDGSSNALELVDFVMSDNEEAITSRVKAFDSLVKKFVSAEVNRTFKDNGRNPESGNGGNADAKNNVAANIGKITADRNAASKQVLNHYLGGKN